MARHQPAPARCTPGCSGSPASHPTSRAAATAGAGGRPRSGSAPSRGSSSSPRRTRPWASSGSSSPASSPCRCSVLAVFGRTWFDQADPFEAWSRLLGLLSPLGRRRRRPVGASHPAARRQRPAWPAWARAHGCRHARRHGIRRVLGEPVMGDLRADLGRPGVAAQDGDPARVLRGRGRDALVGLCRIDGTVGQGNSRLVLTSSPISPPRSSPSPADTSSRTTGRCGSTRRRSLALLSDPLGTGADLLGTAEVTLMTTADPGHTRRDDPGGQHRRGSPAGCARRPRARYHGARSARRDRRPGAAHGRHACLHLRGPDDPVHSLICGHPAALARRSRR